MANEHIIHQFAYLLMCPFYVPPSQKNLRSSSYCSYCQSPNDPNPPALPSKSQMSKV